MFLTLSNEIFSDQERDLEDKRLNERAIKVTDQTILKMHYCNTVQSAWK